MIRGLSFSTLWLYNAFVALALIYLLRKYRADKVALFIIMLFWGGLFADMGKMVQNIYKVATFGYSAWLFLVYSKEIKFSVAYKCVLGTLSVFVLYVAISGFLIHGDSLLLIFSQLSKSLIPVLLIPVLLLIVKYKDELSEYNSLFGDIIVVEIGLNIVKLFILGNWYEGLVGSLSGVAGGAMGTSFPLVGLCWLCSVTDLKLNRYSVLVMFGLLFIGFMAGKRAVWLLFPLLFLALYLYVEREQFSKKLFFALLFAPLLLYFGLRLSPTLNPENKIWGSFDPEYTLNYVMEYSGGAENYTDDVVEGQGRLGANALVWNIVSKSEEYADWQLWGLGPKYILAADSENYRNSDYYMGISNRGALTGIVKNFLAFGILGSMVYITFLVSIIFLIPNFSVRIVMGILLLFDYVFYNATMSSSVPIFLLYLFSALSLSHSLKNGESGGDSFN